MKATVTVPYDEFKKMEQRANSVEDVLMQLNKVKKGKNVVILEYGKRFPFYTLEYDMPVVKCDGDSVKYIEEKYAKLEQQYRELQEQIADFITKSKEKNKKKYWWE